MCILNIQISDCRYTLCKFHRCVQVTFIIHMHDLKLKAEHQKCIKLYIFRKKNRNTKLVNIHRIALQIHLNKHSLIKNEACFKYSTSFLSLSLFKSACGLQGAFSTMESSNSHNPMREASDYERTSPAMPFITCFCMCVCICAHIVWPCITECTSFSLCLYLSVYACMSVCGGR